MRAPVTAYLGLGANLGDPVQQIVDARRCLSRLNGVNSTRCSSLYLSAPVGYADQPSFVNCVLELTIHASMVDLFTGMQRIEAELGRVRDKGNQNAPRLIDIDLLLFGEERFATPTLMVPHPRILQRMFVLQPLSELLPNGAHPLLGDVLNIITEGKFRDQELFRLRL